MTERAIYFDDLTPAAQEEIKNKFNTTPEREYWDLFPLVVLRTKKCDDKEQKDAFNL